MSTIPNKFCPVCSEAITKRNCIHYGALSCYSCRAFFRRSNCANSAQNPAEYACPSGGRCEVRLETRRLCRKCRYDRCLKVGMVPELVLSAKEKRERFKGFYRKNKKKEGLLTECSIDDLICIVEDDEEMKENDQVSFKTNLVRTKARANQTGSSKELPEALVTTVTVLEELNDIFKTFKASLNEVFSPEATLSKIFVDFHTGHHILTKPELDQILILKMKQLESFAKRLVVFSSLDPWDQRQLLQHNQLLYLNFVLANYFSADSGNDQLSCILGSHHALLVNKLPFIRKTPLQNYVFLERGDMSMRSEYLGFCFELKSILVDKIHLRDVITLLFLFHSNSSNIKLLDPIIVGLRHKKIVSKLQCHFDRECLSKIMNVCTSMCNIFESGFIWRSWLVSNHPANSFTSEEELWRSRALANFDLAFRSVPIGQDLINDLILYSKGVPLSSTFVNSNKKLFLQRFLQILKSHEEFNLMSSLDQNRLWMTNGMRALGFVLVAMDSKPSGLAQLKFVSGEADENILLTNFVPGLSVENIKKITIASNRTLPAELIVEGVAMSNRLAELSSDEEIFKLLIILILCSGSLTMNSWYMSMIERLSCRRGSDMKRMVLEGLAMAEKLERWMTVLARAENDALRL